MPGQQCEAVQRWLRQGAAADLAGPPPAQLAAHVAGCAACRGLLLVAATTLLRAPAPLADLTCDACQDLIDAYIECEQRRGAAAALQRYQQVWWHLWGCADCAEVYQCTSALLQAAQTGALAPLPVTAPRRPSLPALRLTRTFLHQVFSPYRALGTAWGDGDDETLLVEDQQAGYQIAVSVCQRAALDWLVEIVVTPPVSGWAVLSCGELRFRARFDQRGCAQIAEVPPALLGDHSGDDILITIEHHDHAG